MKFRVFCRGSMLLLLGALAVGCGAARMQMDPLGTSELVGAYPSVSEPLPRIAIGEVKSPDAPGPSYQIGEAKTGAFNRETPILSQEAPGDIVRRFLVVAFDQMGIETALLSDAEVTLTGEVVHMWVDEYATGWHPEYSRARVSFDLFARDRSGKLLWAGRQDGTMISPTSHSDTTKQDQSALESAILKAVNRLIEDRAFWSAIHSAASVSEAASATAPG